MPPAEALPSGCTSGRPKIASALKTDLNIEVQKCPEGVLTPLLSSPMLQEVICATFFPLRS
jgi:hypothetical protein